MTEEDNWSSKQLFKSFEKVLLGNESCDRKVEVLSEIISQHEQEIEDIVFYLIGRGNGSGFSNIAALATLCQVFLQYQSRFHKVARTRIYSLVYFRMDSSIFDSESTLRSRAIDVLASDQKLLDRLSGKDVSTAYNIIRRIDRKKVHNFYIIYKNLIAFKHDLKYNSYTIRLLKSLDPVDFTQAQWEELAIELLKIKRSPLISFNALTEEQVSLLCEATTLAIKILSHYPSLDLMQKCLKIALGNPKKQSKNEQQVNHQIDMFDYSYCILQLFTVAKAYLAHITDDYIPICDQRCQHLLKQLTSTDDDSKLSTHGSQTIQGITNFILQSPKDPELYLELIENVVASYLLLLRLCQDWYIKLQILRSLELIIDEFHIYNHHQNIVSELLEQIKSDVNDNNFKFQAVHILASLAKCSVDAIIKKKLHYELCGFAVSEELLRTNLALHQHIQNVVLSNNQLNNIELVHTILLSNAHHSIRLKAAKVLQEDGELSDYNRKTIFPTFLSLLSNESDEQVRLEIVNILLDWIHKDLHRKTIVDKLWSVSALTTGSVQQNSTIIRNRIFDQLLHLKLLQKEQLQYLISYHQSFGFQKLALQQLVNKIKSKEDKIETIKFLLSCLYTEPNDRFCTDLIDLIVKLVKREDQEETMNIVEATMQDPLFPTQHKLTMINCQSWSQAEKLKYTLIANLDDTLQHRVIGRLLHVYFMSHKENERQEIEKIFLDKLVSTTTNQQIRITLNKAIAAINKGKIYVEHKETNNNHSLAQVIDETLNRTNGKHDQLAINNVSQVSNIRWQQLISRYIEINKCDNEVHEANDTNNQCRNSEKWIKRGTDKDNGTCLANIPTDDSLKEMRHNCQNTARNWYYSFIHFAILIAIYLLLQPAFG